MKSTRKGRNGGGGILEFVWIRNFSRKTDSSNRPNTMREHNHQNELSDYALREIIGKIKAIDSRLQGLIRYTEYIATNLDSSVDYAEFIGKQIDYTYHPQDLKRTEIDPGNRTPSFKQFNEMRKDSLGGGLSKL